MRYEELAIGRQLRDYEIYRILMREDQKELIIEVTNGERDYEIVISLINFKGSPSLDIRARRVILPKL